jgi:hypothetical protein
MLLKMTAGLSGPLFNLAPGDEYEFETAEAVRLIEAGFAVETETAVVAAPIETRKKTKPKAETENVVSGASYDRGDSGAGDT